MAKLSQDAVAYLDGVEPLSLDDYRDRLVAEGEMAAENAYERHLEDAGYWEAAAQEEFEAARGVR